MDLFRRRLAWQFMKHPLWLQQLEVERSARRPRLSFLDKHNHGLNPCGNNNKPRRGRCRYCGERTQYHCVCAPMLPGMTRAQANTVMFICSPAQNPMCMQMHYGGFPPRQARSMAALEVWKKRRQQQAEAIENSDTEWTE